MLITKFQGAKITQIYWKIKKNYNFFQKKHFNKKILCHVKDFI